MGSLSKAWDSADIFLPMLQHQLATVVDQYIDILAQTMTESLVDRMAGIYIGKKN